MKPPRLALIIAVLAGLFACSDVSQQPNASEVQRFIVIGVDGLEWGVLLPLLHRGRLPALKALMERGHYGKLETFVPARSPAIWTSIATGKTVEKHGIDHFVTRDEKRPRRIRLRTSGDRKTSALWNIFSHFDRRVMSIGWWMTYPVEPVEGVMVAQTNTVSQIYTGFGRAVWKGSLIEGQERQVYPLEREAEVLALAKSVEGEIEDRVAKRFGEFPHPHSELGRRLWENTLWSLRADMIYEEIALKFLASSEPFDLALVYLGAPDIVGHRFWRYAYPDQFDHPPSEPEIENYGEIIPTTYAYVDEQIARLIAAAGDGVNVIVLSDHGMSATNREMEFPVDDPPLDVNSGEHEDGPPGVLIAAGPVFKTPADGAFALPRAAAISDLASVFDIAPTVLALAGIPIGDDMDGRIIDALIRPDQLEELSSRRIDTHDLPGWRKSQVTDVYDRETEAERLEQLRELGYIE